MSEKPSTIVQENINALIERERAGRIEHGGDLDRQDLPVMRWLEELRCESLDSANYAAKLMHLLPKLLAAVEVLERTGFTWDGDEWKSGAAQEAVAWQVGDDFYTSESLAIEGIQQWGPSGSIAIPLYAAPVTAAPSAEAVELTVCCGREECGGECGNEWLGTEWVRKAATPAEPGIDHGNLIASLQSMRDRMMTVLVPKFGEAFDGDFDTMLEAINMLKRADASPKGGSDLVAFYDASAKGSHTSDDDSGSNL